MIIIYINCALFPFISWIIKGLKTYETRNRNTLKRFIGKTVYLAETGKGKRPIIRCSCLISGSVTITSKATYNALRKQTRIKKGSYFDWKDDTRQKILYKLENVQPCKPFPIPDNAIRHGYTWCEIIQKRREV